MSMSTAPGPEKRATGQGSESLSEVHAIGGAHRRVWVPGSPRPIAARFDRRLAPKWPLYATEIHRAVADYAAYAATERALRLLAASGDGHPVLVIPGLMAGDGSTWPLRRFLRGLGYNAHGWRLGRNIGPTRRVQTGLRDVFDDLFAEYDRPATLIGWSLGGIFARELARERPDEVRQVIVLGTPFRLAHPAQTRALRAFERYSHLHVPADELPPPESHRPPLPVPATSIYSVLDGIVASQACLEEPGPTRENVAVYGSHLGLGSNPAVLWAIADRLGQAAGEWTPFSAPWWAKPLYPAPTQYVSVMV
jgi:pimeloyl-ACP methyl ester carboxylesterase